MMKKMFWVLIAVMVFVFGLLGYIYVMRNTRPTVSAEIYKLTDQGISDRLGTVMFRQMGKGMELRVFVQGLTPGEHGFHIHNGISCGSIGPDSTIGRGLAAGGHYDPEHTDNHAGPDGGGHAGDLPYLTADENGGVNQKFFVEKLTADEIAGRAILIHDGPDNYSDNPVPLGGGGGRFGCGILEPVQK